MFFEAFSTKKDLERVSKALVLGGGVSGEAAGKLLKSQGKEVFLADRTQSSSWSGWTEVLSDEGFSLPPVDLIVKSPGISPNHGILQRFPKEKIISEIELGRLHFTGPILGITGTDGKSTTTALTHHLVKNEFPNSSVGGNLGEAFTSFCLEPWDLVVLELSSYQLEDSRQLHLTHSAITNLATDHLERHRTMENYALAKWKIQNLENETHRCITQPNFLKWISPDFRKHRGIQVFGLDSNADIQILTKEQLIRTRNFSYEVNQFPLPGLHNLQNLAVAIGLAEAFGVSSKSIQSQLETFTGLPHRFSIVPKSLDSNSPFSGIQFINDSKSTNLHSMLSGLSGYSEKDKIYLILGGEPKQESLSPFFERWQELKQLQVYIYGKASELWSDEFKKERSFGKAFLGASLPEIIKQIKLDIALEKPKSGIVLLSPACASFDQYKNFQERGDHFVKLVSTL